MMADYGVDVCHGRTVTGRRCRNVSRQGHTERRGAVPFYCHVHTDQRVQP